MSKRDAVRRKRGTDTAPDKRRAVTEQERAYYLALDGEDLPDFSRPGAPSHNPYLTDGDLYAAAVDARGAP